MKCIYVTAGEGYGGPKMYGVLMFKTQDRGWEVNVWPCDLEGQTVSDPVEWEDNLGFIDANILFWKYYKSYRRYVNNKP